MLQTVRQRTIQEYPIAWAEMRHPPLMIEGRFAYKLVNRFNIIFICLSDELF
jgi:hypothetical protein